MPEAASSAPPSSPAVKLSTTTNFFLSFPSIGDIRAELNFQIQQITISLFQSGDITFQSSIPGDSSCHVTYTHPPPTSDWVRTAIYLQLLYLKIDQQSVNL